MVEISRRTGGENLSSQGLVLRWSSPARETYSRIGVYLYYGKRKGIVSDEFLEDRGPSEVDIDWFADKPKVVEIV